MTSNAEQIAQKLIICDRHLQFVLYYLERVLNVLEEDPDVSFIDYIALSQWKLDSASARLRECMDIIAAGAGTVGD